MCLLDLQAVAQGMPDLVLELGSLVTVDSLWAAKLSDPGLNELVSNHLCFFARDGMVARLKLKGIDGRAPQDVDPVA